MGYNMTRGGDGMYEEEFAARLTELRTKKGVSSRKMSLAIGQNTGYISNIECGKALPSMSAFFFICEYLNISPRDFFETGNANPEKLQTLVGDLKNLDDEQLATIAALVRGLVKNK